MYRVLLISIIWLIFSPCLMISAQEDPLIDNQLELKLGSIKNPFKSQLPQMEEELVSIEEEQDLSDIEDESSITNAPERFQPVIPQPETEPKVKTPARPKPTIQPKEIVPLPDLIVSGIIWNSDRPQAIINGYVVDIGDIILDIKITDILKTGIKGEFHGRTITIKTQRSQL